MYNLLTICLLWISTELRIENKPLLISINVAIGLLSVWSLILLANNVLSKKRIEHRILYLLIGLSSALTITIGIMNQIYGEYLANADLENFNMIYLFQYEWTRILGSIFPLLGLIYFLYKLKTVANNVYDSWSDALHFWLPSKKLNQNHKAYHEVIYVTCPP